MSPHTLNSFANQYYDALSQPVYKILISNAITDKRLNKFVYLFSLTSFSLTENDIFIIETDNYTKTLYTK